MSSCRAGRTTPGTAFRAGSNYPWHSIPRRFYFYETGGGVIWGITAQLLYHCLEVILKDDTEMTRNEQEDRESCP